MTKRARRITRVYKYAFGPWPHDDSPPRSYPAEYTEELVWEDEPEGEVVDNEMSWCFDCGTLGKYPCDCRRQ